MTRGPETEKSHQWRIDTGFYDRYMKGKGADIGYGKGRLPVLETAKGIESQDYDNHGFLPFKTEELDYVYSSHCLEHVREPYDAIEEWFRCIKVGGYLIITVPHRHLYEKKEMIPSKWNTDHKTFYCPAKLLSHIDMALFTPNTWRLREMYDNDRDFDYSIGPDQHSKGCFEIVCVIQKIKKPEWNLL